MKITQPKKTKPANLIELVEASREWVKCEDGQYINRKLAFMYNAATPSDVRARLEALFLGLDVALGTIKDKLDEIYRIAKESGYKEIIGLVEQKITEIDPDYVNRYGNK